MVDTCTVTALQKRKKLRHVLYERPNTVAFEWVKERGLYIPQTLFMNMDFEVVLLAGEFLFYSRASSNILIITQWCWCSRALGSCGVW